MTVEFDEAAVRNWLADYLVTNIGCSPDEINFDATRDDLAVGSSDGVVLPGELSELLGRTVSPVEFWQYPTINALARFLTGGEPEPVVEVPPQLAEKLGLRSGDDVKVSSARGAVTVKAVVTARMQPLTIGKQQVFTVWMPYNWGFRGLSRGASTNLLTIDAVDPGAGTQETKACLVNLAKVSAAVASR